MIVPALAVPYDNIFWYLQKALHRRVLPLTTNRAGSSLESVSLPSGSTRASIRIRRARTGPACERIDTWLFTYLDRKIFAPHLVPLSRSLKAERGERYTDIESPHRFGELIDETWVSSVLEGGVHMGLWGVNGEIWTEEMSVPRMTIDGKDVGWEMGRICRRTGGGGVLLAYIPPWIASDAVVENLTRTKNVTSRTRDTSVLLDIWTTVFEACRNLDCRHIVITNYASWAFGEVHPFHSDEAWIMSPLSIMDLELGGRPIHLRIATLLLRWIGVLLGVVAVANETQLSSGTVNGTVGAEGSDTL